MSKSAKHGRQQSGGMIDPTVNPVAPASTSNMSMPIVQDGRCHCHKPHRGHESMTAQMNSMLLAEASSNDSIAASPRTSPSTPPSGSIPLSHTPPATRQDRRKEQVGLEIQDLKEELCIHCFFSSFFPGFDDDKHREKINSLPLLAEGRFKLTSPFPNDTSTRVTWPSSSLEDAFYSPLTEVLNEIVDHVNGTPNPNHDNNVRFISYNRAMAAVTPESLKPDLLLVETTASKLAQCRWEHPITSVEVKSRFWEALKQLGTYAREMMAARPGRQFCWGICFDHTEAAFRLVLFTPDSVHYTQSIVITREAGYREMVKIILALLSQSNLLTVGEDPSRDSTTKVLPNGDKLHIEAVEFDRKSIVGRKTRVLSAVVVEKSGMNITAMGSLYAKPAPSVRKSGRTKTPVSLNRRVFRPSVQTQAPTRPYSAAVSPPASRQLRSGSVVNSLSSDQDTGVRRGADTSSSDQLRSQESPSDLAPGYCLKDIRANLDEQITFAESPDHLKLGDRLVIKESWPLVSRQHIEWEALRSCSRQFGVPEVIYRVTGKHPMPVVCTRQPRVPQHIALRERGHSLQEAGSPRILLTAVLHAIIGHWNLFQKGWLHRDVSIGNVLMLVDPVTKSAPTGLKGLGELTKCQGMLIDGDAMIHFSSDREPGAHRSCTLPFLSRRLLSAWYFEYETFDQYFDDLESFAWVLLWALLEIAEENNKATVHDRAWMKHLNANDLQALEAGKDSIVRQLEGLSKRVGLPKSKPTSLLDPFIEILHHWFLLTAEKEEYGKTETLSPDEESAALYDAFITFTMEKMADLPETWEQSDNSHRPFLP